MRNKILDILYRFSPDLFEYLRKLKTGHISLKCEWPQEKLIEEGMKLFEANHGYRFDINHPHSFTEKILWYKTFYEGDGNLYRLEDKIEFKKYVEEKLGPGHTIPIIAYWSDIPTLRKSWSSLPEEFCLKSNLSYCGMNILFIHNKSEMDYWALERELRKWLRPENTSINSFGRAGWGGTPRLLAEEYKATINNQLYDYKFFCFDGQPFCVYAAIDHFGKDGSHISFYDLDWNHLDVAYGNHPVEPIERPHHFEEMIDYAKTLSEGFPFVRVDFFDTPEQLFVAELTLYPGGGLTPYHPKEFDNKLGELFRLPID